MLIPATGTCCPSCCPSSCTNTTICSVCDGSDMCNPNYHVDIRFFNMAAVIIDASITERYLRSLLLKVNMYNVLNVMLNFQRQIFKLH